MLKKYNCEVFELPEVSNFRESYKTLINYHKSLISASRNGLDFDTRNSKIEVARMEKNLLKSIQGIKSLFPNQRITNVDIVIQYAECNGDIPFGVDDSDGTYGDRCEIFLQTFLDCRRAVIQEAHVTGGFGLVVFIVAGVAVTYGSGGVLGPAVVELGTILFGTAAGVSADVYFSLADCYRDFCTNVQNETTAVNGILCEYIWIEHDTEETSTLDPCLHSTLDSSGN